MCDVFTALEFSGALLAFCLFFLNGILYKCLRCFHSKDSQSKNNSLHWQQVYPYMSVLPISNVHINLLLSNS